MAAGKAGRSGRKSSAEDKELLAELREALENEPPRDAVEQWKAAVRAAVEKKREGKP